jgi:hypothetical protein
MCGHIEPLLSQLDGLSGYIEPRPATTKIHLTSEGSLVRNQLCPPGQRTSRASRPNNGEPDGEPLGFGRMGKRLRRKVSARPKGGSGQAQGPPRGARRAPGGGARTGLDPCPVRRGGGDGAAAGRAGGGGPSSAGPRLSSPWVADRRRARFRWLPVGYQSV